MGHLLCGFLEGRIDVVWFSFASRFWSPVLDCNLVERSPGIVPRYYSTTAPYNPNSVFSRMNDGLLKKETILKRCQISPPIVKPNFSTDKSVMSPCHRCHHVYCKLRIGIIAQFDMGDLFITKEWNIIANAKSLTQLHLNKRKCWWTSDLPGKNIYGKVYSSAYYKKFSGIGRS